MFHWKHRESVLSQKYQTGSCLNKCVNDKEGGRAVAVNDHPKEDGQEDFHKRYQAFYTVCVWESSKNHSLNYQIWVQTQQNRRDVMARKCYSSYHFFLQMCTHIQITHPSIISWAIHCSWLHTEWMHSSHNYCGGSHTLYQSIPVSKSPAENSERAWFPKDIKRFLYLHLREVERGECNLQSIKMASWLIHTSMPRPSIVEREGFKEGGCSHNQKASLIFKNFSLAKKYLRNYKSSSQGMLSSDSEIHHFGGLREP